jgi:folate-binding protein YgfZ
MSLETELEAIRTSAGTYSLTDRAFLRITGSDATRWLNGMVTNSIQDLQPGEGNYNFLLNAQGRIQGDCTIYRSDDNNGPQFLLESDKQQIDAIQTLLDKFIIMDDVELSQMENRAGLVLIGAGALSLLSSTDIMSEDAKPNELVLVTWHSFSLEVMRIGNAEISTYEIWSHAAPINLVKEALTTAGAIELSPAAIEAHRILSGTPKYGIDIRNTDTAKDLPQETNQTHALHFNKGCYLGQEIVERIRSRGQVHRLFTQFTLTGAVPTELPASLTAALAGQTRPAGEITSAVQIGDTIHALGYLRREFATAPLTYPGGTATPAAKL